MLGLLLDVAALWAITAILARESMAEDFHRFVWFALILLVVSGVLTFTSVPPLIGFAVYMVTLGLGMRFLIGASWLGAVIGSVLFVGYRVALHFVLG